jgi:hypothetical protein
MNSKTSAAKIHVVLLYSDTARVIDFRMKRGEFLGG